MRWAVFTTKVFQRKKLPGLRNASTASERILRSGRSHEYLYQRSDSEHEYRHWLHSGVHIAMPATTWNAGIWLMTSLTLNSFRVSLRWWKRNVRRTFFLPAWAISPDGSRNGETRYCKDPWKSAASVPVPYQATWFAGFWYRSGKRMVGVTVTRKVERWRIDALRKNVRAKHYHVTFEPLFDDPGTVDLSGINWIVVGTMTGAQSRKIHTDRNGHGLWRTRHISSAFRCLWRKTLSLS